jgi:sialic acid synthase SpsE
MIVMEKVMEVVSLLNGEDKKKILELANILLKQNKYNKLRKDIEARRDEIKRGEILSHEEVWQNRDI